MSAVSLVLIIDILVFVSSIAAFLAIRDYQKRQGLPYPPGPRPLPLIGNLFDVPREFSWLTFARLSKKHGDVLSFHVFGKVIIVLNSLKANKDLLERRADIYSDRIVIPIIEMMKWDWMVAFLKYTYSWRLARKLLDRSLRPATITKFYSLLETKSNYLLTQVLASPDEWRITSLTMGYGYEVKDPSDPKVQTARKLVQITSETIHPGALLVNDLPFLQYIPESLPWLSYKSLTRYGSNLGQEALHGPMEFVKQSILNGTAQPSLALENLQETEKLKEPERKKTEGMIAGALGSMYLGGTDTTASTVMVFIVAALLHPEIQKVAQEELDAVTMRERLPTFEDRPRLPFVDAICKEVIRWRPITPLGIPHANTRDDVYEGFFIPKGAMVVMNTWAVLHDPVMYPEPDSFKPERFINPDGSLRDDPVVTSLFGFGKRICPGRHLADATIFIVIASLLSVFNIKKRDATEGGPDAYPFTGSGSSVPFRLLHYPKRQKAEELILANSQAP
ncbi:cytochrome P450 [Russula aff. rugulosa BPL654]|nr:cytochrome P450 [Russula aff. rugulosa BPL654]